MYPRRPLSDALVGIIMAKLSLTYGKRFTNAYDLTPEQVRDHWASELAGISDAGIQYALEHLPPDYVPNVLQVRMLACQRPSEDTRRLPPPAASEEMKRQCLEVLAGLREQFVNGHKRQDPLAWAECILANPAGKSRYAINLAREALREKGRIE